MSTVPYIRDAAGQLDLSERFQFNTTVVASPSAATETTIASITLNDSIAVESGIVIFAWCAYTVGTSGTAVTMQIRQTSTSGTSLQTSGATNATAATLNERSIFAWDTAPTLPGQVYVATLTVASAAAASTVSKAFIGAIIV